MVSVLWGEAMTGGDGSGVDVGQQLTELAVAVLALLPGIFMMSQAILKQDPSYLVPAGPLLFIGVFGGGLLMAELRGGPSVA